MPLVLDELPRSWGSADFQTASTLFLKAVPVLLRLQEREEQSGQLILRILSGLSRINHSSRVLSIHIFSEEDLLFLHTLEVSEEEFQVLKVEQGILVDFAHFPSKVISLLEKCVHAGLDEKPRFHAVLQAGNGAVTFKVVETNDFNQLPHITLVFRPGSGHDVQSFLAFRLSESKALCQHTMQKLEATQAHAERLQQSLDETRRELVRREDAHAHREAEITAAAQMREAQALQDRVQELAAVKAQAARDQRGAEERLQAQLDRAAERAAALDAECRELRDARSFLGTKASDLGHQLATARTAQAAAEEEAARLRSAMAAEGRVRAQIEVEAAELRVALRASEDKGVAQREVAAEQGERIRDLEAAQRSAEARCAELKDAGAGHAARAEALGAEVIAANRTIEQLSGEVRLGHERARRRGAIVARQEEELAGRGRALEAAAIDAQRLAAALQAVRADAAAAQAEGDKARGELEEARKRLQSNEDMIRWLNHQVNEAQLGGSTAGLGPLRYTFRPASFNAAAAPLLPTTSSATGGGGRPPSAAPSALHTHVPPHPYRPATTCATSPLGQLPITAAYLASLDSKARPSSRPTGQPPRTGGVASIIGLKPPAPLRPGTCLGPRFGTVEPGDSRYPPLAREAPGNAPSVGASRAPTRGWAPPGPQAASEPADSQPAWQADGKLAASRRNPRGVTGSPCHSSGLAVPSSGIDQHAKGSHSILSGRPLGLQNDGQALQHAVQGDAAVLA